MGGEGGPDIAHLIQNQPQFSVDRKEYNYKKYTFTKASHIPGGCLSIPTEIPAYKATSFHIGQ